MTPLLVVVGAVLAAPIRYLAGRFLDGAFHWGTLTVNLVASLVLGFVAGSGAPDEVVALVGTGFCGTLSTYSAFVVQTVDGPPRRRVPYVFMTILGCLAAAAVGDAVGRL